MDYVQFTNEGKNDNTVLSIIEANINSSDTILFIADPVSDNERTFSFIRYFHAKSDNNNIFTCPVTSNNNDPYSKYLTNSFTSTFGGEEKKYDKIIDKSNIKAIVVFPYWQSKSDSIIKSIGYDKKTYSVFNIGLYQLYLSLNKDKEEYTYEYTAPAISPFSNEYHEVSFYPLKSINEGDSVQIILQPDIEIKQPMTAFIILLDADHPENILVHNQISNNTDLTQIRIATKNISKPWLIYRNWGKETSIPAANISIRIKRNLKIKIPVI